MTQTENTISSPSRNKLLTFATVAIVGTALAIAIGLVSSLSPIIAIALVLLIFVSMAMFTLRWPTFIVVFVAFVIYTNASVVMINFHGVPPLVGYALPLLLILPFLYELIVNKRKVKINFVFVLMLVFLAVMLLGGAFSRDINLSLPGIINYVAEGLGLYFLLVNTIRTPGLVRKVIWSLLIGGAIIGGISLFQQVTGTFENDYWGFAQVTGRGFTTEETLQGRETQPRISGPIGEQNRYAQVMLLLVPIGLFHAWSERSNTLRLLALFMTGLVFIGGSLAFSRGAQVGVLLLLAIMTFMRYIKVKQLVIVLLGIVLLLVAFPQNAVRFASIGAIFSSEEEGGIRSADGAIQGRVTEMLAATYVFMDHPIVGVGPGMFGYEMAEYAKIVSLRHITATREAHSLYPGVAAETGILGISTLMGIFFYVLYRLAKARTYWLEKKNTIMANLSTGFFLSIISYMTTGIFLHFAYIRYFWFFIALAVIVSEFRESDLSDELEAPGRQLIRSEGI